MQYSQNVPAACFTVQEVALDKPLLGADKPLLTPTRVLVTKTLVDQLWLDFMEANGKDGIPDCAPYDELYKIANRDEDEHADCA